MRPDVPSGPLHFETPAECAERLRISRRQVFYLIQAGMPSRKVGSSRRLVAEEVDAWLLSQAA